MSTVKWLIITSEQIFVSDLLSTHLISLFLGWCGFSRFELKKAPGQKNEAESFPFAD